MQGHMARPEIVRGSDCGWIEGGFGYKSQGGQREDKQTMLT